MTGDPHYTPPGTGGSDASLGDLWRTLIRRWKMLFGVSIGVVAVVMAILMTIPPVYESESILRVRSDSSPASGMLDDLLPVGGLGGLSIPGLGDSDVETEIGILRSRRIADQVVDSAALHVELQRPYRRPRTSVLNVIDAGEDAVRGVYSLKRAPDGSYEVSASRTREPVRLPARVAIGEPFEVGNMVLALHDSLRASPPRLVRFRVRPFQRTVTDLRDDLNVSRQDSRSQLIEITYRHRDPRIASGVINGVVDYFMEYAESAEKRESRRKVEILSEQVAGYRSELRAAEDRLQGYQEQERIVAPEEQAIQHIRRIAEIQALHDAAEVERRAIGALIAEVGAGVDPDNPPYRRLAAFPTFISNAAVQDVLETLMELENERAELLGRRTEENQDVRVLRARINELEDQLYGMGINYLRGLDQQIASSGAALAQFGRDLEALPAIEVEFARLVRDQKLLSEVYLLLEGRLREAAVQEAIDDANVRIVDFAVISERPAFPRPLISLVLASVLGLMAGLFTVVGYETMHPSVRSRRDAERAVPGVPVLGVIPRVAPRRPSTGRTLPVRIGRIQFGGSVPAAPDPLIARRDPWHPAAESYRALAAGLFGNGATGSRVLVVTSAAAGEGKTTVAANLALTLARSGARTLLMDADLRAGEIAKLFEVSGEPGWPEHALSGAPLADAVREVPSGAAGPALHLLPAGALAVHPAELLGSEALRRLIVQLRERYDVIVLDTPPLRPAYDAAILGGLADGTLLVVRSGTTGRETVEEATADLRRARAPLAGVVLNDFDAAGAAPPAYAGRYNGADA